MLREEEASPLDAARRGPREGRGERELSCSVRPRQRRGRKQQRRPPAAPGEGSEGVLAREAALLLLLRERSGSSVARSREGWHFLVLLFLLWEGKVFFTFQDLAATTNRRSSHRAKKRNTMRLVCFNVNSWPPTAKNAAMSVQSSNAVAAAAAASASARAKSTSAALSRWLDEGLDADVLCLQETKISEQKLKDIKELAVLRGYESFWSCSKPPRTGYSGVSIYCRSPKWSPTACHEEEVLPATHVFDHIPGGEAAVEALGSSASLLSPASYLGEGRYLEVEFGDDLTLINVYVRRKREREFFFPSRGRGREVKKNN